MITACVPYRCLYSRNINNLFMAGRHISVTHVALGTVRVMRTTGLMGEVVGIAAGLCKKNDTTPRGIYKDHLDELIEVMGKNESAPYMVDEFQTGLLKVGGMRTSHEKIIKKIPASLDGAPCVTVERGDTGIAGAGYKFKMSKTATVYLAVHDRGDYAPPAPWKKTEMKIKWDSATDTLYSADFPAGEITVPSHTGMEGPYSGLPHMAVIVPKDGNLSDLKID